jgi:hypothetical protein
MKFKKKVGPPCLAGLLYELSCLCDSDVSFTIIAGCRETTAGQALAHFVARQSFPRQSKKSYALFVAVPHIIGST